MNAERHYKIFNSADKQEINVDKLAQLSQKYDVVFFGEFHDDGIVHNLEKDFLAKYFALNSNTAVSMEMFERDNQQVVSDFINGKIDEKDFKKSCKLWGNYDTDYKPLLEIVKNNSSYLIAANVPRNYAGLYARKGMTAINKLDSAKRKMIAKDINVVDDQYQKDFIETMMANFGEKPDSKIEPNQQNTLYLYFGAQTLKDETMAESIANYLKANHGKKVIHFNGAFHSNAWLGTVEKLKARMPNLKIAVISPQYIEKGKEIVYDDNYSKDGNFIIVLDPKPPRMYSGGMGGGHSFGNYIIKHDINVKINPQTHSLEGSDNLEFKNPIVKTANFTLIKDLQIESISSPDGQLKYTVEEDNGYNNINIDVVKEELLTIKISYKGDLYYPPKKTTIRERHSYSKGMISAKKGEGVYLPAGSFYPYTEDDMAKMTVKVTFPNDIDIITSGIPKVLNNENGWETKEFTTELSADNLTLVGGHFIMMDSVYDGKTFSVYSLSENKYLSSYLTNMIEYYKVYTKLFGKYPYSNFSLVENFFATGFGMPGYTLISGKLLQMPWVLLSPGSLAHEFCHNWWGNSVYINNHSGNWCEALTTFSANYYFNVISHNEKKAKEWRRKALTSMEDLPKSENYPLEDFMYQKTKDDAVIGYSKGAFLFYELYKMMGQDKFFEAIRTFAKKYTGRRASWFSLQYTFQGFAKKNKIDIPIAKIFKQWLENTDRPKLILNELVIKGNELNFSIVQQKKYYMWVPVRIITKNDTVWHNCKIDKEINMFNFTEKSDIVSIDLDPDFQCLRHLNKWEIPFTFEKILNDNPIIILPKKKSKEYSLSKDLQKMIIESQLKADAYSCDEIDNVDWKNRSIIILGNPKNNTFFKKLKKKMPDGIKLSSKNLKIGDKKYNLKDNLLLMNFQHPTDESKFATIIGFKKIASSNQFRRLFHYMSYSLALISQSKRGRPIVSKEIYPAKP